LENELSVTALKVKGFARYLLKPDPYCYKCRLKAGFSFFADPMMAFQGVSLLNERLA
jgi:hypothetical protein